MIKTWLLWIIGVISVIAIAWALQFIIFFLLKKFLVRKKPDIWPYFKQKSFTSVRFVVLIGVLRAAKFPVHLRADVDYYLTAILNASFILGVGWVLVTIVDVGRALLLSRYEIDVSDNLEARKAYTRFNILANILKFILIVIFIGLALLSFNQIRQFGISILASAGIAGLIVGLAAQKLIATVLAGVQLAITQPVRIDDVVVIEGEFGRIEKLTLTMVIVRLWDQRRLLLPTTYFLENPIQNWTLETAQILGSVKFLVDFDCNIADLKLNIERIVKSSALWDGGVFNTQIVEIKQEGVEIRILASSANADDSWNLRVYIREELLKMLQQQDFRNFPKLHVEVDDESFPYP